MSRLGALIDMINRLDHYVVQKHEVNSTTPVKLSAHLKPALTNNRLPQTSSLVARRYRRRLRPIYPLLQVIQKCCRFGCSQEELQSIC